MKKIACSNVSIALTLVGILPLFGGFAGVYKILTTLDSAFNYSWLFQTAIFLTFGLSACGYRSCLYINDKAVILRRSILSYKINNNKTDIDKLTTIYIDVRHPVVTANSGSEKMFYGVTLEGEALSVDITDYMRFKNIVNNEKSWISVTKYTENISRITGLSIDSSDRIKRLHSV